MSEPVRARKRLSRAESKQQTREHLLDAAEAVFARQGFAGTSVDAVAEEAGYSKGAVYSNFGSKDDLFLALLDRHLSGTVGPNWMGVFSDEALGEDRVEEAAMLLMRDDATAKPATMLELEFFLHAMRHPEFAAKLAARYRGIQEAITETLARHFAARGLTPAVPPEELAWLFPALATGLAMRQLLAPGAMPDRTWPDALRQLLAGIAPAGE